MPDGQIFQFFVTKTDDGDKEGTTKETFGCSVEVGNPLNAEVREFTGDFDPAETGVAAADFNSAARQDTTWRRNYELENYGTKDSILDGFKTLTCTAMINLDQEDVLEMAEKKFDIKIGLKIFADKVTTTPKAIAEKVTKYEMPKEQKATMEPLDPITRDVQILIEDSQTVQADAAGFTQSAPITQNFYSGFQSNPTDESVSDLIGFYFEVDAPKEAVKLGSSVQQWVQFKKPSEKEYKTVQCYSKVGDPFVSEVKSFKGREVMDDSSP